MMEELKQLRTSHRAHRSHLTKTITSITELLERDSSEPLTELKVISLRTTLEGLQRRKGILTNLDAKISALLQQQEELEADIFECEELQTNIDEKIAQLRYFIQQSTRMVKSADAPPPVSESQATTQRSISPPSVQRSSPPKNSVEQIPSTEHAP